MAFSGGVFSLVAGNPVVTGTTISSTWANNTLNDIAANGLSLCVLKDGSQTVTANIPMAGYIFTGLGAGAAAGNSVRYEQVYTTTTLTDQATVSWNSALAPVARWTIGGNRTLDAPTNLKAGGLYGLIVTQDGTGGRTITWNAVFKASGSGTMPQPETTAAAITAFNFYSPDGTNLVCLQCVPFTDPNAVVRGGTDPTKRLRFEVDGFTTNTMRVATMPDKDGTVAMTSDLVVSAAQTFLGSDVNLNNASNYFNVVNTGSIGAAGQVWVITGILCSSNTSGSAELLARIWDGSSTVYVESNDNHAGADLESVTTISAVVTLGAATTFHLSAKCSQTSASAKTTGGSGTANKATSIIAMRIS